ncbi:unnamed protein product, partial [Durusdinium trenchii]
VSDKSVVFRPTALCSIRSAMMQLVRDRKLPKERSYEEDTTEPSSGSETGSERPRRTSQGSDQVEIAVTAMSFSRRQPPPPPAERPSVQLAEKTCGEPPSWCPGEPLMTSTAKSIGAPPGRDDVALVPLFPSFMSPATRSPGSSRACQGSIHGGRSSENSTAAGSSLGPIVSSNFATGYPGEGETLQAHHPQDPRPSCHAGPALEYLRSTLRG